MCMMVVRGGNRLRKVVDANEFFGALEKMDNSLVLQTSHIDTLVPRDSRWIEGSGMAREYDGSEQGSLNADAIGVSVSRRNPLSLETGIGLIRSRWAPLMEDNTANLKGNFVGGD